MMRVVSPRRIGFIGAGQVGTALAVAAVRAGYSVIGLADRSENQLRLARRNLPSTVRGLAPRRVAELSEVLFLTVPDRQILRVYASVRRWLRARMLVAHCSGSVGTEIFSGAELHEIATLAFHPARPFAPGSGAPVDLAGCQFAIDGTRAGMSFARSFARRLGGGCFVVTGTDRPLYHAMCVFASNFQHALRSSAEQVARELDIGPILTKRVLDALMSATLEAMMKRGAGPGLTGPVRRGDPETIAVHLEVLRERTPELASLYIELSKQLVVVAQSQGVSARTLTAVSEVLNA